MPWSSIGHLTHLSTHYTYSAMFKFPQSISTPAVHTISCDLALGMEYYPSPYLYPLVQLFQ